MVNDIQIGSILIASKYENLGCLTSDLKRNLIYSEIPLDDFSELMNKNPIAKNNLTTTFLLRNKSRIDCSEIKQETNYNINEIKNRIDNTIELFDYIIKKLR